MTNATKTSSVTQAPSVAERERTPEILIAEEYFRSFNENQFEQTAALFDEAGALIPPFDSPEVGRQAIQAYLEKEASRVTAFPEQWESHPAEAGSTQITITGKVNAVVFKVNVAWFFTISNKGSNEAADTKIQKVRVKLLASPAELLGLRTPAEK